MSSRRISSYKCYPQLTVFKVTKKHKDTHTEPQGKESALVPGREQLKFHPRAAARAAERCTEAPGKGSRMPRCYWRMWKAQPHLLQPCNLSSQGCQMGAWAVLSAKVTPTPGQAWEGAAPLSTCESAGVRLQSTSKAGVSAVL